MSPLRFVAVAVAVAVRAFADAVGRGAVGLVAVGLAAGCAASSPEVRPIKDASPLEQRFAAHPDDAKVNLELGDRAADGGDWLRAEQYFARAEALGTPPAQVVPRILRALVLGRRYDEALERCHRRLAVAPGDRGTRLVEAALLTALDRPRDAERELTALVRTRPEDPNPYLALGKLYRDSYHDAGRARPLFEKYLALAPRGQEAEAVRYELEFAEPSLPSAPTTPTPTAPAPTTTTSLTPTTTPTPAPPTSPTPATEATP
jgi:tetratricopeptide (TPR) repeat protein